MDKQKVKTIVLKINDTTKEKMINYFEDKKRIKTPPYAIFQADDNDNVITLYTSNKVVFQGLSADLDASMWQEINKGNDLDELITNDIKDNKEKEKIERLPLEISSIGSDEVGTGDYFGPIIVTATYVSKENVPFLIALGVRDSKKILDETILKMVPEIIKKIPYTTIVLNSTDYNNNYSKEMNMNKIKAILHNKALYDIKSKGYPYDLIVVDQFAKEDKYFDYLKDTNKKVTDIKFLTKAEDQCLSVACASLISRYLFIKEINKMGDKIGMFIPKGASYLVDDVAIKIYQKYGMDKLREMVKLNFSNTERIIHEKKPN